MNILGRWYTAEQFGIDNSAPQKRKGIISSVTSLVVAVVAFVIYATAKSDKVPDGAIGQADAMTNIQVEGTFGFDASQVILVVGIIAVTFAVIHSTSSSGFSRLLLPLTCSPTVLRL